MAFLDVDDTLHITAGESFQFPFAITDPDTAQPVSLAAPGTVVRFTARRSFALAPEIEFTSDTDGVSIADDVGGLGVVAGEPDATSGIAAPARLYAQLRVDLPGPNIFYAWSGQVALSAGVVAPV